MGKKAINKLKGKHAEWKKISVFASYSSDRGLVSKINNKKTQQTKLSTKQTKQANSQNSYFSKEVQIPKQVLKFLVIIEI